MILSAAEVTFAPLFQSTHQALVFAFGYAQHEFPFSSLYRVGVPSAGAGRGFGWLDLMTSSKIGENQ